MKRIIKFCAVGTTGVIINMSILWFLTEIIGFHYLISSIFSIEISIITNFIFNDLWTWRNIGKNTLKDILNRAISFNTICIFGLIINMGILVALTEKFAIYYLISNIFGIIGATAWNFFMTKNITWKTKTQ